MPRRLFGRPRHARGDGARAQSVAQTPAYSLSGRDQSRRPRLGRVREPARGAGERERASSSSRSAAGLHRTMSTAASRCPTASPRSASAIEATYNVLYAGITVASVKLPTQPAAEISISGGVRPTLGPVEFDLGVTYFRYPGEDPGGPINGINYWEAALRAGTKLSESLRIAGGFAYSPNVSNTGAWSSYAAGGIRLRRAGPLPAEGHRRVVHRGRRLFLVRSPVRGSGRLSACRPISTGRRE